MAFQDITGKIKWKVHFRSPIEKVYEALSTDLGRKQFWAEKTEELNGFIIFTFFNYGEIKAKILHKKFPHLFELEYFNTNVQFTLASTEENGTKLILTNEVSDETLKYEMTAGWVSVLMCMKAAVDFGVDLRNHNEHRTWDLGYLDN